MVQFHQCLIATRLSEPVSSVCYCYSTVRTSFISVLLLLDCQNQCVIAARLSEPVSSVCYCYSIVRTSFISVLLLLDCQNQFYQCGIATRLSEPVLSVWYCYTTVRTSFISVVLLHRCPNQFQLTQQAQLSFSCLKYCDQNVTVTRSLDPFSAEGYCYSTSWSIFITTWLWRRRLNPPPPSIPPPPQSPEIYPHWSVFIRMLLSRNWLYFFYCCWSLWYSAVLHSRAVSLRSCHRWLWMSDCIPL